MNEQQSHVSNWYRGTPFYVSPEVCANRRMSKASDVVSVLCYCNYDICACIHACQHTGHNGQTHEQGQRRGECQQCTVKILFKRPCMHACLPTHITHEQGQHVLCMCCYCRYDMCTSMHAPRCIAMKARQSRHLHMCVCMCVCLCVYSLRTVSSCGRCTTRCSCGATLRTERTWKYM